MDRRTLLKYLSIGVAGTSLTTAVQSLASASGGTATWGYTGSIGPSNWGSLDPAYAVCGSGEEQSPINLQNPKSADLNFSVNYQSFSPTIKNTGKTIQIDCPSGSTLTLDGKTFDLIQFHFHAPAEHTRNTKVLPMEVHLVHGLKDANGNIVELAVIGVFIDSGNTNYDLQIIFNNIPTSSGGTSSPSGTFNPADLLPNGGILTGLLNPPQFYRYYGSLTTPPCSEIVNWIVFHDQIEASQSQINQFTNVYSNNARPMQTLNRRFLLKD